MSLNVVPLAPRAQHPRPEKNLPCLPRCGRHGPAGCPRTGFTAKVHHMDAKVGGGYRMSFTNFSTGKWPCLRRPPTSSWCPMSASATPRSSTTRTCPGEMQDDGQPEAGVSAGCELHIVQEGIPAVIPVEGLLPRLAAVAGPSGQDWSSRRFRTDPDPQAPALESEKAARRRPFSDTARSLLDRLGVGPSAPRPCRSFSQEKAVNFSPFGRGDVRRACGRSGP